MARNRSARPEAKPLRLFVAADVPVGIQETLAEAVAPFRDHIPGARWTTSERWHVTLKFLGSTWPRLVPWVHERIGEAAGLVSPFETALTTVGVFPSPRRARVVWAGLADDAGRFAELAAALEGRLEEHFVPEKRAFTPHLTLARLNPPRDIGEFAPNLVGFDVASPVFGVNALVLYRSHLSPHGARYEAIARFPLRPASVPRRRRPRPAAGT